MMMFKNQKGIALLSLLFISGLLLTGCTKAKERFIISSDENGIICSAKSTFNDTIFYENRFQDSTIYYYAPLSKQENEELKKLIISLKLEKSIPKFELRPDSGTFIVVSDAVRFYEANYSIPSRNIKKILGMFRDVSFKMKPCKKVDDFWDVEGVTPPDNPVP
ncbi:hypothetical protein [Flavobacterium sangjuense]|nr:hypothetical protein [Flavobacterium sangjuense]